VKIPTVVLLALTLTGLVSPPPALAAPSISSTFDVASHAVLFASHQTPARLVQASDVDFVARSTSRFVQAIALGTLPSYTHLDSIVDETTYSYQCFNFPSKIGAPPVPTPCPPAAKLVMGPILKSLRTNFASATALTVSRNAIAIANAKGRALSAKDLIMAVNQVSNVSLPTTPTFASGDGPKVHFAVTDGGGAVTQVCVKEPTQRLGSPMPAAC